MKKIFFFFILFLITINNNAFSKPRCDIFYEKLKNEYSSLGLENEQIREAKTFGFDIQVYFDETLARIEHPGGSNYKIGDSAKLKDVESFNQKLGYDIIKECNLAFDFFKGVTVRKFNFDNYKEEKIITALKGVNKINLENSIKARDHFTKKLYEKSTEIISIKYGITTLEEFYIIREKYTNLLNFYFEHYKFLQKINEAHGITFRFYLEESNKFFEERNSHETERNYFILFSVLSQILSLFFLIFLFKTLMKISNKKIKL